MFRPSSHRTVFAAGKVKPKPITDVWSAIRFNANARLVLSEPKAAAAEIKGRVAFWKGGSGFS